MHISTSVHRQQGIGMVEVLVALLLLAVGVLGFSALQSYAVYSTTESLNRTQALTVMRGLAERIRANDTSVTVLGVYRDRINANPGAPTPPTDFCNSNSANGCTAAQLVDVDVYDARLAAWSSGIQLGMATCPGTVGSGERQCLLAAWDETTPRISADSNACMTMEGTYRRESTCIVMEIY